MDEGFWQYLAREAAQDTYEKRHLLWQRGIFPLHLPGRSKEVLILYNNNPCEHDPLQRDREMKSCRDALVASDVAVLAEATYPIGGADDGYTMALVIDAPASDLERWLRKLTDLTIVEPRPDHT
jgi:hypothetical protein